MFKDRLKELRLEKSLKQEDLAKVLGVSRGALAKWENGSRETNFAMLVKIAEFFGVTTDYLLGRTDC